VQLGSAGAIAALPVEDFVRAAISSQSGAAVGGRPSRGDGDAWFVNRGGAYRGVSDYIVMVAPNRAFLAGPRSEAATGESPRRTRRRRDAHQYSGLGDYIARQTECLGIAATSWQLEWDGRQGPISHPPPVMIGRVARIMPMDHKRRFDMPRRSRGSSDDSDFTEFGPINGPAPCADTPHRWSGDGIITNNGPLTCRCGQQATHFIRPAAVAHALSI